MGSVWLSLRADFRLRWRPLAALALLLGLIGGVVLTAAAGARRTDTAYPRLLQWARAAQVDVLPGANGPVPPGYFAALARLPQVAAMSVVFPVPDGAAGAPRPAADRGDELLQPRPGHERPQRTGSRSCKAGCSARKPSARR